MTIFMTISDSIVNRRGTALHNRTWTYNDGSAESKQCGRMNWDMHKAMESTGGLPCLAGFQLTHGGIYDEMQF